MSAVFEYSTLRRTMHPEFASDIVHFRHREWPEHEFYVSRADIATQKERGMVRVPTRDKAGRKLSAIHESFRTIKAADKFAKAHGWPFMAHLANIEGGDYVEVQP